MLVRLLKFKILTLFNTILRGPPRATILTLNAMAFRYYSLMKSDRDLRTVLYKQIVLAGGSTMYQGYGDRLLNEVRKLSPEATKITISGSTFAPRFHGWLVRWFVAVYPPQRHLAVFLIQPPNFHISHHNPASSDS